jgi:hypothetical protein
MDRSSQGTPPAIFGSSIDSNLHTRSSILPYLLIETLISENYAIRLSKNSQRRPRRADSLQGSHRGSGVSHHYL